MTEIIKEIVGKHVARIVAGRKEKIDAAMVPWELVELGELMSGEVMGHFNGAAPFPLSVNLKLVGDLKTKYIRGQHLTTANILALERVVDAFYRVNGEGFRETSVDKLKPEYCDLVGALMHLNHPNQ